MFWHLQRANCAKRLQVNAGDPKWDDVPLKRVDQISIWLMGPVWRGAARWWERLGFENRAAWITGRCGEGSDVNAFKGMFVVVSTVRVFCVYGCNSNRTVDIFRWCWKGDVLERSLLIVDYNKRFACLLRYSFGFNPPVLIQSTQRLFWPGI